MAKVIRNPFVWKKYDRWWRYLPRRDDGHNKLDLEELADQCATFPEPMPADPPKLWVAWIYRNFDRDDQKIQDHIHTLFGKEAKPGEMHVFKNTQSTNRQLWKLKHLLEIRPMTFPNGEPKPEDIYSLEVFADGRCVIDPQGLANPEGVRLVDPSKQFSQSYLVSRLRRKDIRHEDVFEDTVYTPENVSIS